MRRFAVALLGLLSCSGDPVHDDLVRGLGPEPSGAPGPLHRAGQPCLACHGGSGPASLELSVGGTIYVQQGKTDPLEGAEVQVTDLAGRVVCSATTNAAGNFFLRRSECTMPEPAKANVLRASDGAESNMITRIGRSGSCATCHHGDTSTATSVERIYLLSAE